MRIHSLAIAITIAMAMTTACAALADISAAAQSGKGDPALNVRNASLNLTWPAGEKPPLPVFGKVALAPVQLEFRDVEPNTGPAGYTGTRREFPVSETQRRDIAVQFDRIFREELAKSDQVTLVNQAGADTLLLRPALKDIVSLTPPDDYPGRGETFVDTVGEATLVLEVVDGGSGTLLGTATDRRKAEPADAMGGFGAVRANPVSAGYEVRRLAHRWGMKIRERVEQLYFESKPR